MSAVKTYICNGRTKLTVKEIKPGVDELTVFELMGDRWVQLGPPEWWTRSASLEVIEAWEEGAV